MSRLSDHPSVINEAKELLGISAATGIDVTYTSGSAPATNGSITIADSSTPTVTELLEFCEELNAKLAALSTDAS